MQLSLLRFDYVNHRGEKHTYKVLPINVAFERCKCFPLDPEREAWVLKSLVLERSGIQRHVMRSFALVKMNNVEEVTIKAD